MHLPPYVLCAAPPTAARAVFVPGPIVLGAAAQILSGRGRGGVAPGSDTMPPVTTRGA